MSRGEPSKCQIRLTPLVTFISSPLILFTDSKLEVYFKNRDEITNYELKMPPLATVGILSIGEMGMGIAKLLVAHNYRVVTNLEGRR